MNHQARMRLRGMVRKEWLQILRDPSSIAIAFLMPVLLLFLFGYGVSLDAKDIPLGFVIDSPDSNTASFRASFDHSDFFRPQDFASIQTAQQSLAQRRIDGIVWLRGNFSSLLLSGQEAPIAVRVNAVDANQARITEGYIQGAWLAWLGRYAHQQGRELPLPVVMEQRVWFNAALISRHYLVPGLVAIIMTLTGSLLTALVVAREWERGTMEALMVTPLNMKEMLVGKLIPYFILGMGGMLFTVALAVWQFDVPFRGSFTALFGASALFMLVALALGLLISIVSRNQFVAGQVAIIITFLPAFILSGFIFDIHSMPEPIQVVTHVVPARYLVSILQSLFLAGDVWPVYWANMGGMLILLVVLTAVVRRKAYKRLD
ncbi:ABC transporter permease [Thiolapillus brandeum]|uniref:ABC-2 type transporter permease n=1 Tax=Thiolapillus brandeum TaxID=1076588 RepID=A0A7U6GL61_9GAMM|nr:ABC transporter permease [Thiolapillus brandeum]BAO45692.1 ABC-2 type transporter permease [Thiolapillus brandeum]